MTQILRDLVDVLENTKATEINVIDIQEEADFSDYFVICTATSTRHAKTIAEECIKKAKAGNFLHHSEIDDEMDWVIVDCYDVIIHIMQSEVRAFYQLDSLWEEPTTPEQPNDSQEIS